MSQAAWSTVTETRAHPRVLSLLCPERTPAPSHLIPTRVAVDWLQELNLEMVSPALFYEKKFKLKVYEVSSSIISIVEYAQLV